MSRSSSWSRTTARRDARVVRARTTASIARRQERDTLRGSTRGPVPPEWVRGSMASSRSRKRSRDAKRRRTGARAVVNGRRRVRETARPGLRKKHRKSARNTGAQSSRAAGSDAAGADALDVDFEAAAASSKAASRGGSHSAASRRTSRSRRRGLGASSMAERGCGDPRRRAGSAGTCRRRRVWRRANRRRPRHFLARPQRRGRAHDREGLAARTQRVTHFVGWAVRRDSVRGTTDGRCRGR